MKQFRVLDPNLPDRGARGLCALAVMTKAPQAGRVKTRLVPPLTPEEAAELNKCFLRDTAAAISSACSRRPVARASKMEFEDAGASHSEAATAACGIAVYTPVGAESAYNDILPADFSLLPQRGDKFGERLYFAVEDLFKCGFGSVCLIDSDSPTVPAENFAEAVELLSTTRGSRCARSERRRRVLLDWSQETAPALVRANRLEHRTRAQPDDAARNRDRNRSQTSTDRV